MHWSAVGTCASQLAALSRAGLRCAVGPTFADVDEVDDLRALDRRLRGGGDGAAPAASAAGAAARCEHTAAFLAQLDEGAFSPASLHRPA